MLLFHTLQIVEFLSIQSEDHIKHQVCGRLCRSNSCIGKIMNQIDFMNQVRISMMGGKILESHSQLFLIVHWGLTWEVAKISDVSPWSSLELDGFRIFVTGYSMCEENCPHSSCCHEKPEAFFYYFLTLMSFFSRWCLFRCLRGGVHLIVWTGFPLLSPQLLLRSQGRFIQDQDEDPCYLSPLWKMELVLETHILNETNGLKTLNGPHEMVIIKPLGGLISISPFLYLVPRN